MTTLGDGQRWGHGAERGGAGAGAGRMWRLRGLMRAAA